jgi:nucleoside-diphosphate-sugar epimerase
VRDCLEAVYDLVANSKGTKKPLFLFTSGNLMYGDGGRVGEAGFRGLAEDSPYNPHEGAKFRIPVVKELFARTDLLTSVLLPSFIYGRSSSYYAYLFLEAKTSDVLRFPGCPNTVRTGVHVDDAAAAYVMAANNPHLVHGNKFNIAGNEYDTFDELFRAVSGEFGGKHVVEYGGGKGDTVPTISQWLLNDKIKRVLGWKPLKPGFREGIKEYIKAWEASEADGFIPVPDFRFIYST